MALSGPLSGPALWAEGLGGYTHRSCKVRDTAALPASLYSLCVPRPHLHGSSRTQVCHHAEQPDPESKPTARAARAKATGQVTSSQWPRLVQMQIHSAGQRAPQENWGTLKLLLTLRGTYRAGGSPPWTARLHRQTADQGSVRPGEGLTPDQRGMDPGRTLGCQPALGRCVPEPGPTSLRGSSPRPPSSSTPGTGLQMCLSWTGSMLTGGHPEPGVACVDWKAVTRPGASQRLGRRAPCSWCADTQ